MEGEIRAILYNLVGIALAPTSETKVNEDWLASHLMAATGQRTLGNYERSHWHVIGH